MIPILMYHRIGEPSPKGFPYRGLTVHPSDFQRQMTWLRRFGYRGLSMRDLIPYIRGERQGKVIGITFDDGYRNVFQNAMPILENAGFTATNYFVARQLGGGNVWDYEKGIPHSDLMSIAEMRAWAAAGHEVGSHTLDHSFLPKLSSEAADYQIRQSKLELEQALGAPVAAFCYPYGGVSPAIRDMVAAAGYSSAATTRTGLAGPSDNMLGLPRITVDRSTSIFSFLWKCMARLENRRRAD